MVPLVGHKRCWSKCPRHLLLYLGQWTVLQDSKRVLCLVVFMLFVGVVYRCWWLRCFETFLQRVRGDIAVETRCNTARSLLESNNRIAKMRNWQFAPAQSGQSEHSTWPDRAQSHPVANSPQNIVRPATLCNDSIPSSWMCNDVSREYQRCIEIHDSRTTAKGWRLLPPPLASPSPQLGLQHLHRQRLMRRFHQCP